MTRIVRIGPDTIGLLDRIAPDVFDAPIDPELIGAMFAAGNHHLFVALDADLVVGQCLGMVLHGPDRPAALYIDNLGVTGTHRRQGIGSDICHWERGRVHLGLAGVRSRQRHGPAVLSRTRPAVPDDPVH